MTCAMIVITPNSDQTPIASAQVTIRSSTSATSAAGGSNPLMASSGRKVGRHDPCEPWIGQLQVHRLLSLVATWRLGACGIQPVQQMTSSPPT